MATVAAPAGYGKTVAVQQYVETARFVPVWIAFDNTTRDHSVNEWSKVVEALERSIEPRRERQGASTPAADGSSVGWVVRALERSRSPVLLVLDDVPASLSTQFWRRLRRLVDEAGWRLRTVITARFNPPLPISDWRLAGWLVELREGDLRLRDDEAVAIARLDPSCGVDDAAVVELNHRVEGWPIALRLGLLALRESSGSSTDAETALGSSRYVAELLDELLAELPEPQRHAASELAILEWIDAGAAQALMGRNAVVVAQLRRLRFLEPVEGRSDRVRFHRLVRELLLAELRWKDPDRAAELHRVAADHWQSRGEPNLAYRLLIDVGDRDAVDAIVIAQALRMADRGDRAAIACLLARVADVERVDQPALAVDLAIAAHFAGHPGSAVQWIDRAEQLGGVDDYRLRVRMAEAQTMLDAETGDLDAAVADVAAVAELWPKASDLGPVERRLATVAAKVALLTHDLPSARLWLDRATTTDAADAVRDVILPGLEAAYDIERGLIHRATQRATQAVDRAAKIGMRPHQGALDTILVTAWCHLLAGDLPEAQRMAQESLDDADRLRSDWNLVLAAEVATYSALHASGPSTARIVIEHARRAIANPTTKLARRLDIAEATAIQALGNLTEASALLDCAGDRPEARVRRASLALARGERAAHVRDLLADAASWTAPARVEAGLLEAVACRDRDRVRATLRVGAAMQLVLPFLAHGPAVDTVMLQEPLERLHPKLVHHLRRPLDRRPEPSRRTGIVLTDRERAVLVLLPSNLNRTAIAERLHVGGETVKSHIKSIYRKLGVTTRAEAVEVAREIGLI